MSSVIQMFEHLLSNHIIGYTPRAACFSSHFHNAFLRLTVIVSFHVLSFSGDRSLSPFLMNILL